MDPEICHHRDGPFRRGIGAPVRDLRSLAKSSKSVLKSNVSLDCGIENPCVAQSREFADPPIQGAPRRAPRRRARLRIEAQP
jgi:hypothetical protein